MEDDDILDEDLGDDELDEPDELETPYFGRFLYRDGRRIDPDGEEVDDDEPDDVEDPHAEDPSDPRNWDDDL